MKPRQATSCSAEIAHSQRKHDVSSVHKYANVNCPAGGNGSTKGDTGLTRVFLETLAAALILIQILRTS